MSREVRALFLVAGVWWTTAIFCLLGVVFFPDGRVPFATGIGIAAYNMGLCVERVRGRL